jgi:pSer/pThr/pTyr-binding forkhead associated (FHA) protein
VSNQTKVFSTGGLSGMTDNKTKVFRPGKASIEFSDGPMKDKKFQVGVPGIETVLVGRDVDVITGNIKVDSEFVSRRHAKITLEDNKLYLYDLGSASGTRINGVSLSGRIELRDGDMIEFADTPAVVKMTSAIPAAGRPNA